MKKIVSMLTLLLLLFSAGGCSNSSSKEKEAFDDSMYFSLKANRISQKLPSVNKGEISQQEEKMISYMKKSIKKSHQVTDAYLKSIDPELPGMYRNYLIKSQKLYVRGIENGNVRTQKRATNLLLKWQAFYRENKNKIMNELGYD